MSDEYKRAVDRQNRATDDDINRILNDSLRKSVTIVDNSDAIRTAVEEEIASYLDEQAEKAQALNVPAMDHLSGGIYALRNAAIAIASGAYRKPGA